MNGGGVLLAGFGTLVGVTFRRGVVLARLSQKGLDGS